MNNIIKFHRSFNKLWEYRLKNMKIFTTDMHLAIVYLSIFDYHIGRDNKITLGDYKFIKEKMECSQDFINKNKLIKKHFNICFKIIEAFILIEKLI